ncbi:Uncharacterised protein [Mycobacteroides abscessus subsp. abscessus]|nr:Uncharacterised protein [Mycobacteroides abscessus subsp. abscessus]
MIAAIVPVVVVPTSVAAAAPEPNTASAMTTIARNRWRRTLLMAATPFELVWAWVDQSTLA